MTVEKFLAAVLPSQGHRFVLVTFGEQGQPDFRPVQRAVPAGSERRILSLGQWGVRGNANVYFASGGFMPPPLDEHGKQKGGRTADRVTHFRCVRLDIDCGVGKDYADKHAGLQALAAFCNQYALPIPWLVDSGYGLHVYWTFDRDITVYEWLQLAQQLATACAASGFKVDATTTLDAARVLRLPGTYNFKRGAMVQVRILHEGSATTTADFSANLPASSAPLGVVPAALRGLGSELQKNLHTPYTLRGVLSGCPGMGQMLADGGVRAAEPLWKQTLDLIWGSSESDATKDKVARAMSQGHPGFNEAGFAGKWQQVKSQNYHPPTCASLEKAGLPECARCPFRGKISSPIVHGYPQAAIAPSISAVPPPPAAPALAALQPLPASVFQVGVFRVVDDARVEIVDGKITDRLYIRGGKLVGERPKPDGTPHAFTMLEYRISEVERLLDAGNQNSVTSITFDRGLDHPIKVAFNNAQLTDPRQFHSAMLGNGLYVSRKIANDLMEMFMPEFLSQLQRARAASKIASRLGWTDDMSAFVLGTRMVTQKGVEHIRPGSIPEEMLAFHEAGDRAAWARAFDIVLAGGADRQAVVALAMASPLMAFTGLNGVMLNAYSKESGIGKSTLGDAALSVWGSPDKLRKSARDTINATWRIAGVLGNMPLVMDEFTNIEGRALSDFVYTVTQGREKHRLTSDARLQSGGGQRWCLATITTANNSVHDKLQSFRMDAEAEATRVFDMRLFPLAIPSDQLGGLKRELQALTSNYGFLGTDLVHLYLSKPTSYWRDLIMAKISRWDVEVARSASDRFRSATAALIEVGAAIGAAMGYRFDVPAIRDVVQRTWRAQIEDFDGERRAPIDYVTSYIQLGEIVQIGGANGDSLVADNPRKIRGEIRGRTVNNKWRPDTVMIPTDMLRHFIREQKGDYKAFNEWLKKQLATGLVTRMGRLTFLQGQMLQHKTNAIEFSAAIFNDGVMLQLAPQPTMPAAPARATK